MQRFLQNYLLTVDLRWIHHSDSSSEESGENNNESGENSSPSDNDIAGPSATTATAGRGDRHTGTQATGAAGQGGARGRQGLSKAHDFRAGWTETKNFIPRPLQFTGVPGPTANYDVVQIFMLYFTAGVWDLLVTETNRYADQTMQSNPGSYKWASSPIDVAEMKAFVAIVLAMGITKLPQYRMFWSTSEILINRFYPSITFVCHVYSY